MWQLMIDKSCYQGYYHEYSTCTFIQFVILANHFCFEKFCDKKTQKKQKNNT